jgi:hypothetical protein
LKVEIYLSNGKLVYENYFPVSLGLNTISLYDELKNVQGLLQVKTTSKEGEVLITRVIKLK